MSAPRRRKKIGGQRLTPARGLAPLVAGLVIWQLVGHPDSPYFPPPSEWWYALVGLVNQGVLFGAIWETTWTFLFSLIIATVLGTVIGLWIGGSRLADRATSGTFEFLRVLPASAIVPLMALLLGYTLTMKAVVVVLVCIWPIVYNSRQRRMSLSPVLIDSSRVLHLRGLQRFRKVILPSVAPSTLVGVSIAAPLALIITLLVEIVTSIGGLGMLLTLAQATYRTAEVYGLLVVAGILGFIVNEAVSVLTNIANRR